VKILLKKKRLQRKAGKWIANKSQTIRSNRTNLKLETKNLKQKTIFAKNNKK
jgi:hypothetical protein